MANLTMNTTEEKSSKPLPASCQENSIDTDMKSPGAEFNLREFLLVTLSNPTEYWRKGHRIPKTEQNGTKFGVYYWEKLSMRIGYICFGIVKQNILLKNSPMYPLGKGNWAADQHAANILNFLPSFSWSCDQEWSYFYWFGKNSRILVCFACHV